jgi:acylphosphatase
VRAQLLITGRVQGVWYRGAMQEEARRLSLAGWVRNRVDGAVEAEVEGPRDTVDALLAWARQGPPAARVKAVQVTWVEPRGERSGFAVRG